MERSRRAFPVSGNVALKGVATQSSQWENCEPHLAIDGNKDANLNRGSCSSTAYGTNSWWRVDLLDVYSVKKVQITNRVDCCPQRIDGAEIRIGNSLENNGLDNPSMQVPTDNPLMNNLHDYCMSDAPVISLWDPDHPPLPITPSTTPSKPPAPKKMKSQRSLELDSEDVLSSPSFEPDIPALSSVKG
ncbi:hypothetical protein DPEC_G00096770 [Dallia pectoralis]|uniref:Uncharacterized protein n=1 Tax=Dallia pectoralis TaxID=75939 RepID=A0ACC2GVI8_DALPE|nr:hypothetical protein DPEC_G00096770 [Dallia pectoralis]